MAVHKLKPEIKGIFTYFKNTVILYSLLKPQIQQSSCLSHSNSGITGVGLPCVIDGTSVEFNKSLIVTITISCIFR